jgi:hypothetical protein
VAFSFYIYYRVVPEKASACEPLIRSVIAAVRAATGIQGRLLMKRGEPNLWMEVYEGITDEAKFEWELAEIAGRLKVQECLQADTTRHHECFVTPDKA